MVFNRGQFLRFELRLGRRRIEWSESYADHVLAAGFRNGQPAPCEFFHL